jgi:hypothetical protein
VDSAVSPPYRRGLDDIASPQAAIADAFDLSTLQAQPAWPGANLYELLPPIVRHRDASLRARLCPPDRCQPCRWAWAFYAFLGHPMILGTVLLAYSFGLRHAVDADHIAAIDNVTRKLMQEGGQSASVCGFRSATPQWSP